MQTIRASRAVSVNVRASAKPTVSKPMAKLAQLAGVAVSSLALTLAAHADANVKLGSSTGALVFEPETVTISAGESVTFVNNAGFPHNIVFDEDAVPAGVSVDAISREDYMNAPGETYTVKLDTAGEYGFYCEPHQGALLCGPDFELHARSPLPACLPPCACRCWHGGQDHRQVDWGGVEQVVIWAWSDNANMVDAYYGGRAVQQWYQQQASPTEAIHLSPISSPADWVASGSLRSLHACLATLTSTPLQPTVHLGPTTTTPSQPGAQLGPAPTTPSQPGSQPGPVTSVVLSGPPGPLAAAALSATMPPQVLARFLAYLASEQAIVDGGGGSSTTGLVGQQPGGSSSFALTVLQMYNKRMQYGASAANTWQHCLTLATGTVAQRVLCIPTTAAAYEWVFSAFSHVWSDKRASLILGRMWESVGAQATNLVGCGLGGVREVDAQDPAGPGPGLGPGPGESEPEPVTQPPQRRCSARLAALAPAAPTGPLLPLDCEDPVMLRQLMDFCMFFSNPNYKTCYNQLQRRHVRHRHPMLMPAFEDPSNQALLAKLQELGSINLAGYHNTIDAHSMQLAVNKPALCSAVTDASFLRPGLTAAQQQRAGSIRAVVLSPNFWAKNEPGAQLGPMPTTPFQPPPGPAATIPSKPPPGHAATTPSQPGSQPVPVLSVVLSGPPGPLAAALSATMPPQMLARVLAYLANQQAIVDGGGGSSTTGVVGQQPDGSSITGLTGQQPGGSSTTGLAGQPSSRSFAVTHVASQPRHHKACAQRCETEAKYLGKWVIVSVNVRASAKPTVSKPMAKLAQLAGVAVSSLALTLAAHADANVKLGSSTGALVFEPETVTISAGESVTFVNNAGFPHNIVFDEDAVPAGVSVDAISREDYMNAPGETYTVKLDTAGEYGFYCEPHQGATHNSVAKRASAARRAWGKIA
ncbi:hypothetical protein QJQ45_027623 [Haematococcus lacustris]|nr:hypothetical protein QJQ45_027623 [Haematococcus lacustris]